jgi:hypothetical protein
MIKINKNVKDIDEIKAKNTYRGPRTIVLIIKQLQLLKLEFSILGIMFNNASWKALNPASMKPYVDKERVIY